MREQRLHEMLTMTMIMIRASENSKFPADKHSLTNIFCQFSMTQAHQNEIHMGVGGGWAQTRGEWSKTKMGSGDLHLEKLFVTTPFTMLENGIVVKNLPANGELDYD